VRNFVKSLSRDNSRENKPIKSPSIKMEEIYDEKEAEDIVNDIPILTRQSTIKNPIKSSLLSNYI
jgi:hypothetical protein